MQSYWKYCVLGHQLHEINAVYEHGHRLTFFDCANNSGDLYSCNMKEAAYVGSNFMQSFLVHKLDADLVNSLRQ